MPDTEVAVVGAGPAGIAAALAATGSGARVTLVDESPLPGGQIHRQPPPEIRGGPPRPVPHLLRELSRSPVEFLGDTLVYGADDPHTLALYRGDGGLSELRAGAIVIATGGYDRPVAFPGWTLPGVLTAGGLQAMVKSQRVAPGRRVAVAGTGPFLMPVAAALVHSGVPVAAVVEATTRLDWLRHALRLGRHTARLREALAYQRALARAHVPYLFGHVVTSAEGDGAIERVTIARVDRHWRPRRDTQREIAVDCLGVGYGFLASVELARLLGCAMRYDGRQDQTFPWHGANLETSVAGVFVAGETTGIGGAELARAEGTIAGLGAARRVGRRPDAAGMAARSAAIRQRRSLQGFADVLNDVFALRRGIYELPRADTVLCRCEDITYGEARAAIRQGVTSVNGLKRHIRVGMGPCQGRMCGHLVARLIQGEAGLRREDVGSFTPRPPIKPIPLGAPPLQAPRRRPTNGGGGPALDVVDFRSSVGDGTPGG